MADLQQENDIELVQRTLRGERPAFKQLVERYENYVFSVILRVVKQREEAEEVAQDVFIKVYNQLGSFQQRSQFSTWLYTIAYRTALDHVRKKRLNIRSIDEENSVLQLADQEKSGPSSIANQSDLEKYIHGVLEQLKPQDALLIHLYYLRERSVAEISQITGLSATNIKTKLFRLREQLRQLLSSQLKEEIQDLL